MMLFSQVVDILISLSAFSDRGRSVVESVMNQIALLWMLTREEEQKQNATTHDGTEEKAGNDSPPPTAAMLPPMSKDKMWGLLNFYLNLTRHLQRGKQCMPLQAKEKLLGLLNTLVMSTGSAVHRGAVRAQVRFCSTACAIAKPPSAAAFSHVWTPSDEGTWTCGDRDFGPLCVVVETVRL